MQTPPFCQRCEPAHGFLDVLQLTQMLEPRRVPGLQSTISGPTGAGR
jgi:hypothetical protein